MVKVCVLQTDNRPSLNYLLETQKVNKKFCNILGYDYLFLHLDNNKYGNIHPATKKIHLVNNFLLNTTCDILVFLDSDAWIQNGYLLNDIINNLINNCEEESLNEEEINEIQKGLEDVKKGRVYPIEVVARELGISLK